MLATEKIRIPKWEETKGEYSDRKHRRKEEKLI
jgi:hypothetical protein